MDDPPAPILHEDDHLLVVDKPPHMLVVPAPGRGAESLVDLLGRRLGERLYAVHRLDEETSGVVLLARTGPARSALEGLFRSHAVERLYHGITRRVPSPEAGRIESRLDTTGELVRSVPRGGRRAVTHYRCLGRRGRHALVEFRLETGRRNQIRVHMADLGCPLVGDRKYGDRPPHDPQLGPVRRVLLHARSLRLRHPITGQPLEVVAEPPHPALRWPP